MTIKRQTRRTDKRVKAQPKPIEDDRLELIIGVIANLDFSDLEKYHAWSDLEELSSNTVFEGIEPNPDGIFETEKNRFEAVATVYVTLEYGGKGDRTAMSDSYPARVSGRVFEDRKVEIENISVDTSSFYE